MGKREIMDAVKEITIAMIENDPNKSATAATGKCVADFMQVIYEKLIELNSRDV